MGKNIGSEILRLRTIVENQKTNPWEVIQQITLIEDVPEAVLSIILLEQLGKRRNTDAS